VRLFARCLTASGLTYAMQLADKVKKLAGKTHKDRVNDLNTKLEALSEHHDIPKVSTTDNLLVPRLISFIRLVLDKAGRVPPRSSVDCFRRVARWNVDG
jgi:hypothetical protein